MLGLGLIGRRRSHYRIGRRAFDLGYHEGGEFDLGQGLAEQGQRGVEPLFPRHGEFEGKQSRQALASLGIGQPAKARESHGAIEQQHLAATTLLLGQQQRALANAMGMPEPQTNADRAQQQAEIT